MNEPLSDILNQIGVVNFSSKGKLCLNMIVKNESRIIERLLSSVLPIIDTFCIYDTGSTDDTVAKIEEFMKRAGKPGIVISEPFRNFGYNRTFALEKAAEWGEYALLLDADMKLVITPEFSTKSFTATNYLVKQRGGGLEYFNTRIVKTGIGVRCIGPTHEYYDIPKGSQSVKLTTLWIEDIGDGGAKADKFQRDVRLLVEGIREEPTNDRYHFYLANSYKDLGETEHAIDYYKKRVEMGGWVEEVFYACYEIGNMYERLKNMELAVFWWLEAWNRRPCRAESLYKIVHYYREQSKHTLAAFFLRTAMAIPFPADDTLFINTAVYDYLLYYEYTIIAYYTKDPIFRMRYLDLIGTQFNKVNVLANYKFYTPHIGSKGIRISFDETVERTIAGATDTYTSSTPCIIPYGDGYLMNIRYVNYTVNAQGGYDFKHDNGKIATLQKTLILDYNFNITRFVWKDKVQFPELRYQGVEDVKIVRIGDDFHCIGTIESSGGVCMGIGNYSIDSDTVNTVALPSPNGRTCEKNWAMFEYNDALYYVYEWSPLTILDTNRKEIRKQTNVPPFFRDLRGSSNGVLYKKELWFLTHLVHYDTPRYYYHLIVVLDAVTLKYKRHSCLFKFHESPIEYCLGFVVKDERVLFSYSCNDASSVILAVPLGEVDALFA